MTWGVATWVPVAWGFFGLAPWAIDRGFARWYPERRIAPEARERTVLRSRHGRRLRFAAVLATNATIFGLCWWLGTVLQRAGVGQLREATPAGWAWALVPVEALAVLLLFDTQFFWVHWLAHRSPALYRRFHREHHADHHPDAWSATYQHPLDLFLTTASPMAWGVVLPIHAVSWWLALVVANYINLAGHSGFEVTRLVPGVVTPHGWLSMLDPARRGLARLVQTVTHHDLHHQRCRVNYALYFTHWDRLLGTLAADTDAAYRVASGLAGGTPEGSPPPPPPPPPRAATA